MPTCDHITTPARYHLDPEPAETCGAPALPGEGQCEEHLQDTGASLRDTLELLRGDIAESELRRKASEAAGMPARAAVHARRARNASDVLGILTGTTKVPAPGYEPITAAELDQLGLTPGEGR